MEILICYNKGQDTHIKVLNAFVDGLPDNFNTNISIGEEYKKYIDNANIVVVFGSGDLNRGSNARHKHYIINRCKRNNKPYIMFEEGSIKRGGYWSIFANGLYGRGYYTHSKIIKDRIDNISNYKKFKWSGDTILITKQLTRDATVDISGHDYINWLDKMVRKAGKLDYNLEVREHPVRIKKEQEPIENVLKHTRFLITYSSNSAVDAILQGVPCYIESNNHLASDLSIDIENIDKNNLDTVKQKEILNIIANTQWTINEIQKGKCWNHVKNLKPIRETVGNK